MPCYFYRCDKCGWTGDRLNVPVALRDSQRCTEHLFFSEEPCGGLLVRPDELPDQNFQIDASGTAGSAVLRSGQVVKGQFGGGHSAKRRFKP